MGIIGDMPIVPDDKDWTWVLDRPCPACGLDLRDVAPETVADRLRANAASWASLLDHPAAAQRPSDDQWSALEYGCHVRDAFRRFDQRLALLLAEADPTFDNWDQDVTAIEERYGEQDPTVVAGEIVAAAAVLADGFDAVVGDQWLRPGRRSDGVRFTVASMARYALHDPVHHVWDVETAYAAMVRHS